MITGIQSVFWTFFEVCVLLGFFGEMFVKEFCKFSWLNMNPNKLHRPSWPLTTPNGMGIFSATFSSVRLLVTEKETWSWTSGEELWPRRPMLAARTSTTNTSLLGPLLCRRPGRSWASRDSVQWTATRLRARPCMPRPRPFGGHEMPRYASAVPAFVVVHGARFAMICLAGHLFSMYSCTNCWAADSLFILSTNMFARVKMRFEAGKGFLVTTAWRISIPYQSYLSPQHITAAVCKSWLYQVAVKAGKIMQNLEFWATSTSFSLVNLHCGKDLANRSWTCWKIVEDAFSFQCRLQPVCSLLSNSLSSWSLIGQQWHWQWRRRSWSPWNRRPLWRQWTRWRWQRRRPWAQRAREPRSACSRARRKRPCLVWRMLKLTEVQSGLNMFEWFLTVSEIFIKEGLQPVGFTNPKGMGTLKSFHGLGWRQNTSDIFRWVVNVC